MKYIYLIVINFILLCSVHANENIKLLSTTSTRDSGLLEYLLPNFENEYKIKVHVIALGTGQALNAARRCDGDILLTHSPDREIKFILDGYGSYRKEIMHNDFVLIGPADDPANARESEDIKNAFIKIYKNLAFFVSRGDESGTHLSENKIWNEANLNPKIGSGQWYLESGQGMGSTLNIAIAKNAYTYSDRATWLKFKNKSKHNIIFENDKLMFNQYSIVRINNSLCKNINEKNIELFYNWILSAKAKELIRNYKYAEYQLFYPSD